MRQSRWQWQRSIASLAAILAFFLASFAVGHLRNHPAAAQTSGIQLAETGQALYSSGQYRQALSVWQQAAEAFELQDDPLNQAMALNNLSLSAQQLGQWTDAETATNQSLELLRDRNSTATQQRLLATSLDSYAQLQFSTGRPAEALERWQESARHYSDIGDANRVAASRINQARAQQNLGLYSRACSTLLQVLGESGDRCEILDSAPLTAPETVQADLPLPLRLRALSGLGTVMRVTGQLRSSYDVLTSTWPLAQTSEDPDLQAELAIALGNTAQALGLRQAAEQPSARDRAETASRTSPTCNARLDSPSADLWYRQAQECYQQASTTPSSLTSIQARLNQLALATRIHSPDPLLSQISQLQADLDRLPDSSPAVNARLNLAQTALCLKGDRGAMARSPLLQQCPSLPSSFEESFPQSPLDWSEIETLAASARDRAQQLGDRIAESYATGYLGAIAWQAGDPARAEQLTVRTLQEISAFDVPSAAYLWQWQLGRFYSQQGDRSKALSAYSLAVETLNALRSDLVAISPEVQFNFRDSVEPVYREFVDLLLQSDTPSQAELRQAREAIEALQLAELNDFFREACETQREQSIDAIDAKAAVFYSILLPRRLAVILSVPNRPLSFYSTTFEESEAFAGVTQGTVQVEQTFDQLFARLNPAFFSADPLRPHQQFYDWLVRPFEETLANSNIETLVFVLDGLLRGIPVAALHDGQQYLIERYAVALTPGLQLLDARTISLDRENILAGGVAESRQGFAPLPGVAQEVEQIAALAPAEVMLDGEFTRNNLQERVSQTSYPLVHLATHAQLSSRSEDTFLLTWDDRVNVKDLDALLRSRRDRPIELLVLSACQTAVGDKRAALGLAGMAVRSGARSTVATLWAVQDASTADAIGEFYSALQQGNQTKAKSLQQAQLALLHSSQYAHPFYWAPFVMVGNWM